MKSTVIDALCVPVSHRHVAGVALGGKKTREISQGGSTLIHLAVVRGDASNIINIAYATLAARSNHSALVLALADMRTNMNFLSACSSGNIAPASFNFSMIDCQVTLDSSTGVHLVSLARTLPHSPSYVYLKNVNVLDASTTPGDRSLLHIAVSVVSLTVVIEQCSDFFAITQPAYAPNAVITCVYLDANPNWQFSRHILGNQHSLV